jgi:hypothetical protein
MNRQKLILCLLLVALAGSLVYAVLRSPTERRVATLTNRPGVAVPVPGKGSPAAPRVAGAPAPGDGRVHLAQLDQELPRFSGFRRNLFSPIFTEEVKLPPFRPLPPPPRPVEIPLPPPQAAVAPPPPVVPPAPTPDEIAAGELAKFTFLGFLKQGGARTVFLSSNNEIFLAKKGTTLLSKFQVSDLTDDAITIKTIVGGRELVIPLVENRALSTRTTRNP